MRSENETSGAQEGAVSAIVIASLTPMTMPAMSGPSALPRPPSITTAKTTPAQAVPYIGVVRFQTAKISAPDPLDRRFDRHSEAEGHEQRVERAHREACEHPVQRRAEEEERRHDRGEGEERVHARGRELVGE